MAERPADMLLRLLPHRNKVLRTLALLGLLTVAAVSIPAPPPVSAQTRGDTDRQASEPDRSSAVTTDQAASRDRSLSVPAASNQGEIGDSTRATQVPVESGDRQPTNQVSQPDTGRDRLATLPVEGSDVCDLAEGAGQPAICDRPIETRSSEFSGRTRPRLSAEQRILAQQNPGVTNMEASDSAARRLATNRASDLSSEDFAIASVAIGANAAEQAAQEEAADVPADATGVVDAILGTINANTPQ